MHEQFWQLERGGKFVTVRLEHDRHAGYVDIRAAGLRANVRTVEHPDGTTSFDFNLMGEPISILLRMVNGRPIYIFHDPQAATQPAGAPAARPLPAAASPTGSRTSPGTPAVRPTSTYGGSTASRISSVSAAGRPAIGPGPGYIADPDSGSGSFMADGEAEPYGTPASYGLPGQYGGHAPEAAAAPPPYGMPPAQPTPSPRFTPPQPAAHEASWTPPGDQPESNHPPGFSGATMLSGVTYDPGFIQPGLEEEAPRTARAAGLPAISTNVIVLVSSVLALLLFGVGISYLSKSVKALAVIEWKPFVPELAGYSIEFPGPVKETAESLKAQGGYMKLHSAEAVRLFQGQRITFTTAYADFPEASTVSPETALAGARKAVLDSVKGTLVSSKDVTLGGFPGTEFTISSPDQLVHQRVYVISRRIYNLAVMFDGDGNAKSAGKPDGPDERFLNSFKLTDQE